MLSLLLLERCPVTASGTAFSPGVGLRPGSGATLCTMSAMRVVTWNMNHWQRGGKATEAWTYLDEHLRPDVALLQETVPPPDRSRTRVPGSYSGATSTCTSDRLP